MIILCKKPIGKSFPNTVLEILYKQTRRKGKEPILPQIFPNSINAFKFKLYFTLNICHMQYFYQTYVIDMITTSHKLSKYPQSVKAYDDKAYIILKDEENI